MNNKTFFKHHPVAIAFLISWVGSFLAVGPKFLRGEAIEFSDIGTMGLAMMAGPSLAGILMTYLVDGNLGLRSLFSRMKNWRVGPSAMKKSKFSIDPSIDPLITSFIVVLFLFWIGHFTLTRLVYPAGQEITVAAGIVCGILAVLVLYAGYRRESQTWKGILGLCSGYFCWVVFAEVGETLGWGLEIGPANIPLNLVSGAILYLSVIHKKVILDPALLQALNFFYFTWTIHVLDLIVYYSPVFGGPTPEMGEGATWGVWSQARLNASIMLWGIELALLVFLLYQYIRPKFESFRSVQARIGGGFWLLLFFWSVAMEIPVKWFGIEMY